MEKTYSRRAVRLSRFGNLLLMAVLAGAITSRVHAQAPKNTPTQAATPTTERDSSPVTVTGTDYRIGPGDVIEVKVDKAEELSGNYRVTANGTFRMYYLGEIVALDKSPEELSVSIADSLRGRYLRSPRVTVEVKQYNSRAVFVQGSVRSPGVYHVGGRVSLLKLISLCGGLTDNHGSSAFIFREAKANGAGSEGSPTESAAQKTGSSDANATDPGEYTFSSVSISGLQRGNLTENVMIEPHDIVNIPPADVFFVAGEVRAPGSFPLKPGTTLRQAISLAQGTTLQAATSRAMIFREDSSGQRTDMKIDVGAIMSGKSKDFAIQANDVIIIPNSKLKSVGTTLLRSLGLSVYQVIPRY